MYKVLSVSLIMYYSLVQTSSKTASSNDYVIYLLHVVCDPVDCSATVYSTTSSASVTSGSPEKPFPVAVTAGAIVAGGLVVSAVILTIAVLASVLVCLKGGRKANENEFVTSLAINQSYGRTRGQVEMQERPREESLYAYPMERVYHTVPSDRAESTQNTGYATLSH